MASTLLTLLDDLASLLDDVAMLSRAAARKTAGVIGDDLALNAEQVTGMQPDREIPVVLAVAKGALLNKVILVPTALLISAFAPQAITPLLMLGGLVLCYEGFGKIWASLVPSADAAATREPRLAAVASPQVDMVAFERDRIKGAIKTDFILSAEIIVIALGTMASAPMVQQIVSLSLIGFSITVLVYGLVAGLVKLDDLGLRLQQASGSSAATKRRAGAAILRAAPAIMHALSLAGTAAMFLVGGSIIAHGVPPLEHAIEAAASAGGSVVRMLLEGLAGVAAGGVVVAIAGAGRRLFGKSAAPVSTP